MGNLSAEVGSPSVIKRVSRTNLNIGSNRGSVPLCFLCLFRPTHESTVGLNPWNLIALKMLICHCYENSSFSPLYPPLLGGLGGRWGTPPDPSQRGCAPCGIPIFILRGAGCNTSMGDSPQTRESLSTMSQQVYALAVRVAGEYNNRTFGRLDHTMEIDKSNYRAQEVCGCCVGRKRQN